MTHPLTAVIIQDIEDGIRDCILSGEDVETNHLRVGADWQLEQCLEFLKTYPFHERDDYECLGAHAYAQLLEEAMRPTQENN